MGVVSRMLPRPAVALVPGLPYGEAADLVEALPALLVAARLTDGVSMRQAADEMGTHISNLSRFETGKGQASIPLLVTVLRWLAARDEAAEGEPRG